MLCTAALRGRSLGRTLANGLASNTQLTDRHGHRPAGAMMSDRSLPPFIERSMRAQQLLPSHRPILKFCEAALSSFQRSNSKFDVIGTIPHRPSSDGHGPRQQPLIPLKPTSLPKCLVILDSSFNPPTVAHLRMAVSALQDVHSDYAGDSRLLLLLAVNNADKSAQPAEFDQRLAMMLAFARDIHSALGSRGEAASGKHPEGLAIDVALTTLPYFHDKSAAIAKSPFYGDTSPVVPKQDQQMEQVFLAGFDTLIRIFNPKYYPPSTSQNESDRPPMQTALSPFFDRARVRVTLRRGDEWGEDGEQRAYIDSLLHDDTLERAGGRKEWASKVELVEGREAGEEIMSSTLARKVSKERDWVKLGGLVSTEVRKWVEGEELYGVD